MNTSALLITVATVYFFYKMLVTPPNPDHTPDSEKPFMDLSK